MKSKFLCLIGIVLLYSSCGKKLSEFDNSLAGDWKMTSITGRSGVSVTKPSSDEVISTFDKNKTNIQFKSDFCSGSGAYTRQDKGGINISVQRLDGGNWPNGIWLDMYLDAINKATSYIVVNTELKVKTSDLRTIVFTKI